MPPSGWARAPRGVRAGGHRRRKSGWFPSGYETAKLSLEPRLAPRSGVAITCSLVTCTATCSKNYSPVCILPLLQPPLHSFPINLASELTLPMKLLPWRSLVTWNFLHQWTFSSPVSYLISLKHLTLHPSPLASEVPLSPESLPVFFIRLSFFVSIMDPSFNTKFNSWHSPRSFLGPLPFSLYYSWIFVVSIWFPHSLSSRLTHDFLSDQIKSPCHTLWWHHGPLLHSTHLWCKFAFIYVVVCLRYGLQIDWNSIQALCPTITCCLNNLWYAYLTKYHTTSEKASPQNVMIWKTITLYIKYYKSILQSNTYNMIPLCK